MKTKRNLVKSKVFNWLGTLSILSSVLLFGCLNPIEFIPEEKVKIAVEGEISIDNINSAELQFRNHTSSVDIYKINIDRRKEDIPTPSRQLEARITGSPIAGRQDSLFVRPVGKNVLNNLNVLGYTLTLYYRTSEQIKNLPAESTDPNIQQLIDLRTQLEEKGVLKVDGQIEIQIDELPRGRCVIHFYRDQDYNLHAEVEDTYDKLLGDYFADKDFIQDIRIQNQGNSLVNNINLDNLEVSVTALPPVNVEFSPEISQAITDMHLKLADIQAAIVSSGQNVANATITAGEAIANAIVESNGTSPYGKNFSALLIQNWTEQDVTDILFSQTKTFDNSPVEVAFNHGTLGRMDQGQGQGYAVLKNGAWNLEATIGSSSPFQFKNLVVPAQKYLHIYEKTNGYGLYPSEKEWGTIVINNTLVDISQKYKYDDWKYGRIEIQNFSSSELAGIEFKKRDGSIQTFYLLDIAPGKGNTRAQVASFANPEIYNPGKAMSSATVAGDYLLTVLTKDGYLVLEDHNTTIKAEKFTSGSDNKIYIFEDDTRPVPPPPIGYALGGDGGPPAAETDDAYTTKLLTLNFDKDPGALVLGNISITNASDPNAAIVTLDKLTQKTSTQYVISVTVTKSGDLALKVNLTGVDDTDHHVSIFLKNNPQPPDPPQVVRRIIMYNRDAETFKIILAGATGTTYKEPDEMYFVKNTNNILTGVFLKGEQPRASDLQNQADANWRIFKLYEENGETLIGPNGNVEFVRLNANKTFNELLPNPHYGDGTTAQINRVAVRTKNGWTGKFVIECSVPTEHGGGNPPVSQRYLVHVN